MQEYRPEPLGLATAVAPQGDHGFIFAATGPLYTALAQRAARNMRLVMPGALIDLFSDQDIADPVFDRIHRLADGFIRPKMEAMRRSRFDRTIYLDADMVVLADVSELFRMVDDVEIAACLAEARVPEKMGGSDVPRAFAGLNSGMMVIRKSAATDRFLADWEAAVRDGKAKVDQGHLRALLFRSRIPHLPVPPEYNLFVRALDSWQEKQGAPRVLHVVQLHRSPAGDPTKPFRVDELLTASQLASLRRAVQAEGLAVPVESLPVARGPFARGFGLRRMSRQVRRLLRRR